MTTTTKTKQYRWQMRKALVDYLRVRNDRRIIGLDNLEEMLTDLYRSGSCLASEAKAAIFETSDAQFDRLFKDVAP